MLADFKADLLVSQVSINPKAQRIQLFRQILTIITLIIGNIENCDLSWSKPCREHALILFNQDTNKPLKRAKYCSMQHNWRFALGVICNILGTKAARHREIYLNSATLPHPSDTVLERKLDFRAIERTFARQQLPIHSFAIQGFFQCGLSFIPNFI